MLSLAVALATTVTARADTAVSSPMVFSSAEEAFERGVLACEAVYASALRREKPDPNSPGPFARRGFYMSASGDEAKVNMLMLGNQAHVYKGDVKGGAGVVYVVLSKSPLACRVGSFDAPASHANVLKHLNRTNSGWAAQPTSSPTSSAGMQLLQKQLVGTMATLNVSWASGGSSGPNGLSAMATMILQGGMRALSSPPPSR